MTGTRQLLYVLALLEAGLTILATLGQTLTMGGGPAYAVVGLVEAALYVVAGVAVARGRRYGAIVLIICEGIRLVGFTLSTMVALLPWVGMPLTVMTLIDGYLLPNIVIILAARSLPARPVPVAPPDPTLDIREPGLVADETAMVSAAVA